MRGAGREGESGVVMGARYTLPVAAKIGAWREARGMGAVNAIFGEEEESIREPEKTGEIFLAVISREA